MDNQELCCVQAIAFYNLREVAFLPGFSLEGALLDPYSDQNLVFSPLYVNGIK